MLAGLSIITSARSLPSPGITRTARYAPRSSVRTAHRRRLTP